MNKTQTTQERIDYLCESLFVSETDEEMYSIFEEITALESTLECEGN